jgi:hypothetical protein
MTDARFETHGCVLVRGFLDPITATLVSDYFQNRMRRGDWEELNDNPNIVSRYSYYADPLIEALLVRSTSVVEGIAGCELLATYSYARVYQAGEELKPHVDRPSCEVSVTVNVASNGAQSPLCLKYRDSPLEKYVLNPGDAIVYKGCEAVHWRAPLSDDQLNAQFMLHYVDKNGPNAAFEKDKRPDYGFGPATRST